MIEGLLLIILTVVAILLIMVVWFIDWAYKEIAYIKMIVDKQESTLDKQ